MRQRTIVLALVLVLLAGASSGCSDRVKQPDYWPASDWRTSTPEEQGLDSSLILAMLEEIQRRDLGIHSLLIVRHGYLVTEVYFPPYKQDMKHPIFSMTKSITSTMVGKAIQAGYIQGASQKVLELFPEIARDADPRDAFLKDITVEHLLTMSAGFNTTTMPDLYGKDTSFDTVRHILTYNSVLDPPGATFYYDSGLPHLLSAIIQTRASMTLQNYTEQELFQPLGITDIRWSSDPRGITTGGTGLMLLPRDMAKIGYLYLHSGEWNGVQLLPKDWVEASTSKHIETKGLMNPAEDDGYGYLWWIDSSGGFSAHGYGGQFIYVLPSLDTVIVFTGGLSDPLFPVPNELVKSYLIPAAQGTGPLALNARSYTALAGRIQAIEQGKPSNAPLPKIAQEISGRTFRITQEPHLGWYDSFTLTFPGRETYRNETRWTGGATLAVTGSLGRTFFLNRVDFPVPPVEGALVPVRGRWLDEATFVEEYIQNLDTDIDLITQKYTFAGDQVTIEVSSGMNLFSGEMIAYLVK